MSDAVIQAEKEIGKIDKNSLPPLGLKSLRDGGIQLVFGANHPAVQEKRAFAVHSVAATGAIRLGAEFLAREVGYRTFYTSSPTWGKYQCKKKNLYLE